MEYKALKTFISQFQFLGTHFEKKIYIRLENLKFAVANRAWTEAKTTKGLKAFISS